MKTTPRRNFLKMFAVAGSLTLLPLQILKAQNKSKPMKKIDGTFRHHVYFWLKDPEDKEARKTFIHNLTSFLEKVDVILAAHVGEPAGTPREVVDNSYHYDLLVTFKNKEEQDLYQEHPAHKKFVEDTAHLWTRVQVYDSLSIWPR